MVESLDELATVHALGAERGAILQNTFNRGGAHYIVGDVLDDNQTAALRLLLLRVLQLARGRTSGRHITVLVEELATTMGRAVARSLGTIRSRGVNMVLTHQALSDLGQYRDQVLTNCSVQAFWRTNNAETADYAAELSGTIPALARRWGMQINPAGRELREGAHHESETKEHLLDQNLMLSLPSGVAAWFGVAPLATLAASKPLKTSRSALLLPQITPATSAMAARPAARRQAKVLNA
jgi:hypothetical protein